jgi:Interferon-induced transmembrane protein/zinc-ribbon domain
MFCRSCGTQNADNASTCIQCGAVLQATVATAAVPPPANNLAFAIVVTVLCCLPLGIPAIVYAAQVNTKAQAGDIAGAMESARRSRMWSWWSLGTGLVAFVLYGILAVLAAIVENN